ncbi:MAG TPA: hypothetical protein VGQ71_02975 [Terriglobales bacterium]|jgi:hypothetical protein|nr:hypothetical protein [Terriglobales bacterium]
MKKLLVIMVLALAVGAMSQTTPQPTTDPTAQPGQAAQPGQPAQQQQRKEIKDPAEYNAYIAAIREQNPQAQVQALESFVQQYPNSVVREEALEQLMAAYEKTGNAAKTTETASRLLQVNPNNIRALALLAYTRRAAAEAGQNPQQSIAEARQFGERGLQALQTAVKPEGMADADWQKFKQQVSMIFNGAIGFAALQTKDYATAQRYLQATVAADPNNIRNVYPLALAYLEVEPMNPIGLWYVARAVHLSQNNPQILKYAQFKYTKYHGSLEGWDQLLAQARAAPLPPPGFTVTPAPSPAEQARILAESKDPKKMDFGEWQLILTEAKPAVAQRVWNEIKDMTVPFAAKVISANRTTLLLAATYDAIQKNVADVQVTMAAPLTANLVPKPGSEIQVQAKPESYDTKPFLMKMTEGQLIVKAAPKPTPRKTNRRRG